MAMTVPCFEITHMSHSQVLADGAPTAIPRLLTVDDLAVILRKHPASIRNDLSRAPGRLPPRLQLGSKRAFWLESSVVAWLHSRQEPIASADLTPAKRRGRPTKAEQARRERAAAQEAQRGLKGGAA